ncbi:S8 family peptidase [Xanthomonas campestris]|uniref:S8 family peptidase n=1 Tax=Xanthomonas campestris TaxID=339 RepID=UPI001F438AE8|nr:S8 family peptidase [Xanthomonas campestris]MCF8796930.1 S8 family serine peptidase [Xanthomonas campestris pv. campestris]MCF8812283.1 S8 family serine peptidase [Xanthomonas campestris pv. campestris]MEA9724560.1 S8 family peptidase [Xanthomonas campestris]MEB1795512.1 S8 family peptidase [Xanthomonas campestris pv. campestris]MEB1883587.1 S8 family peptidase [Xanthomonas campestris pv. campestris]
MLAQTPATSRAQPRPPEESDPLFRYQWHLLNDGQEVIADTRPRAGTDLNVGPLHTLGLRGQGVTVAVVDDALELRHPDLVAKVVPGGSKNFVDGSNDPTPRNGASHGTMVGGIMAAVGWNGLGGRGVAPDARLKGFNILSSEESPTDFDTNLRASWGDSVQSRDVDVFNNSFGSDLTYYPTISPAAERSLDRLMRRARNGKGGLYVQAAGNTFDSFTVLDDQGNWVERCPVLARTLGVTCSTPATDPLSNQPLIIATGAVNARGLRSSYSSAGAALWVTGFGGEFGLQRRYFGDRPRPALFDPAIVTTDLTGCAVGDNRDIAGQPPINALASSSSPIDASCNYSAAMNGTSAAAPTVAGVVALIVQANPSLTARDLKYILATSARQIDPAQQVIRYQGSVIEPGWITNAAGHAFSNWYGFGLVDAAEAVYRAYGFQPLPPQRDLGWKAARAGTSTIGGPNAAATLRLRLGDTLKIDTVQWSMQTTHKTPSNLRVVLISPSGTRSYVLTPFQALDTITQGAGFEIPLSTSNAFLDENVAGTWTLEVTDMTGSDVPAQLTGFKLRILGH